MIKLDWGKVQLLTKIKQHFIGKADKLLGLDIGTGFVKVAQVKLNGSQPVLTHLGLVELPAEIVEDGYIVDKERMADTIRECVVASRADAKSVVIGLGGRNVFSREIVMPAMPPTELAEAIKWNLEEYVPYPIDSFYYDFAVMGPSEDGLKLQILLVAAPHDVVDPLIEAVAAAGLQLVAIETEVLALFRTLQGQEKSRSNRDNCLILDMGAQLSQISIFQQGAPMFTRIIPLGGLQFTQVIMRTMDLDFDEADQLKFRRTGLLQPVDYRGEPSITHQEFELLINEIAREVRRTIDYYITQNNRAVIDQIFLAGGGANFENILSHVINQLDVTIELLNPLAFIKVSSAFEPRFLQDVGPQMAIAIGLALRGDQP